MSRIIRLLIFDPIQPIVEAPLTYIFNKNTVSFIKYKYDTCELEKK